MTDQNASIVITGGSSGIGFQLAQSYAQQGLDVIAIGNRAKSEISPALDDRITYVQCDLGNADALDALIKSLSSTPISLLILNAGTGWYGDIAAQDRTSIRSIFDVNLTAPIALAHGLFDTLKANAGKVVFIGSSAVKSPTPLFATYTASKAALAGFAKSLALEWDGDIHVQCIHPGPTRTDMHQRIGMRKTPIMRLFPSAQITAQAIQAKIAKGKNHRFGILFMLRHAWTSWKASA